MAEGLCDTLISIEKSLQHIQWDYLLIIWLTNEFDNDILLWLYLKHLEDETEKWCWFHISTIHASHVFQFHSFIDE